MGSLVSGGVFLCGPGVEGEIEGGLQGLVACLGWGMTPQSSLVSWRVLTDAPRLRFRTFGAEKMGNMLFCLVKGGCMNWNFGFFDVHTLKRAAQAAGLGAGASALSPQEAEGRCDPIFKRSCRICYCWQKL